MKKNTLFVSFLITLFLSSGIGVGAANASWVKEFCASYVYGTQYGWWESLTYPTRVCYTDYRTWNTTSLAGEESSYITYKHQDLCGYGLFTNPGTVQARAYIPGYDSVPTGYAHYYRWRDSSTYYILASINQATPRWVDLGSAYPWDRNDRIKLSDWTSNEAKYTRWVMRDAFRVTCP